MYYGESAVLPPQNQEHKPRKKRHSKQSSRQQTAPDGSVPSVDTFERISTHTAMVGTYESVPRRSHNAYAQLDVKVEPDSTASAALFDEQSDVRNADPVWELFGVRLSELCDSYLRKYPDGNADEAVTTFPADDLLELGDVSSLNPTAKKRRKKKPEEFNPKSAMFVDDEQYVANLPVMVPSELPKNVVGRRLQQDAALQDENVTIDIAVRKDRARKERATASYNLRDIVIQPETHEIDDNAENIQQLLKSTTKPVVNTNHTLGDRDLNANVRVVSLKTPEKFDANGNPPRNELEENIERVSRDGVSRVFESPTTSERYMNGNSQTAKKTSSAYSNIVSAAITPVYDEMLCEVAVPKPPVKQERKSIQSIQSTSMSNGQKDNSALATTTTTPNKDTVKPASLPVTPLIGKVTPTAVFEDRRSVNLPNSRSPSLNTAPRVSTMISGGRMSQNASVEKLPSTVADLPDKSTPKKPLEEVLATMPYIDSTDPEHVYKEQERIEMVTSKPPPSTFTLLRTNYYSNGQMRPSPTCKVVLFRAKSASSLNRSRSSFDVETTKNTSRTRQEIIHTMKPSRSEEALCDVVNGRGMISPSKENAPPRGRASRRARPANSVELLTRRRSRSSSRTTRRAVNQEWDVVTFTTTEVVTTVVKPPVEEVPPALPEPETERSEQNENDDAANDDVFQSAQNFDHELDNNSSTSHDEVTVESEKEKSASERQKSSSSSYNSESDSIPGDAPQLSEINSSSSDNDEKNSDDEEENNIITTHGEEENNIAIADEEEQYVTTHSDEEENIVATIPDELPSPTLPSSTPEVAATPGVIFPKMKDVFETFMFTYVDANSPTVARKKAQRKEERDDIPVIEENMVMVYEYSEMMSFFGEFEVNEKEEAERARTKEAARRASERQMSSNEVVAVEVPYGASTPQADRNVEFEKFKVLQN